MSIKKLLKKEAKEYKDGDTLFNRKRLEDIRDRKEEDKQIKILKNKRTYR